MKRISQTRLSKGWRPLGQGFAVMWMKNPVFLVVSLTVLLLTIWQGQRLLHDLREKEERKAQVLSYLEMLYYSAPDASDFSQEFVQKELYLRGHRRGWYNKMLGGMLGGREKYWISTAIVHSRHDSDADFKGYWDGSFAALDSAKKVHQIPFDLRSDTIDLFYIWLEETRPLNSIVVNDDNNTNRGNG